MDVIVRYINLFNGLFLYSNVFASHVCDLVLYIGVYNVLLIHKYYFPHPIRIRMGTI